jgi:beta-galactosidase/beta-glucuronidase
MVIHISVSSTTPSVSFIFNVSVPTIRLWQPASLSGVNNNKLYTFTVKAGGTQTTRVVGFRSVAMRTRSSNDPEYPATGNFTMQILINNGPIVMRGASWIPSSFHEGRITSRDLITSLKHAAAVEFCLYSNVCVSSIQIIAGWIQYATYLGWRNVHVYRFL